MCLAAADDVTRQRCLRIIEAASKGPAPSSLPDIASSAALTRGLMDMKSVLAVKAVHAALGVDLDHPSLNAARLRFDPPSLKVAGFDVAAFRAAGCDWSTIKTAGFTAPEVAAAGCDLASAQAAGYDVLLLVSAFGYDAVEASDVNLSSWILVSVLLCITCA